MADDQKTDNIMRGVVLITISVFMISAMRALSKYLSATISPVEITFYRNILILTGLSFWLTLSKNWGIIKTKDLFGHAYRGIVGTTGIILSFTALAQLPLADATTLLYTGPLFVTLLSYVMLGEKVGPWRGGAVFIGFLGVFFVAAPSGQNLPLTGVLYALSGSFFQALTQLQLRKLGRSEHHLATVFYFMLFGTLITAIPLPFVFSGPPAYKDFIPLALLGIVGVLAQILKTEGYAIAPTTIVTPINYTGLVWAALIGFVVWHDVPGSGVILGAGTIIASNLLILWRELYLKKKTISLSDTSL